MHFLSQWPFKNICTAKVWNQYEMFIFLNEIELKKQNDSILNYSVSFVHCIIPRLHSSSQLIEIFR